MLSDQVVSDELMGKIEAFLFAFVLSLITGFVGWTLGFFKRPKVLISNVEGFDVLKGFAAFLIAQIVLVPAFIVVFFSLASDSSFNLTRIDKVTQGWLNLAAVLIGFTSVFVVFLTIPANRRKAIWGETSKWYYHLIVGALSWFICYPFVLAFNQLTSMGVYWFFRQPEIEQVAVRHIRGISVNPLLFTITFLGVICLVPIAEEILFRGLLQSWLRSTLKRPGWAILLTSAIFALFHFSTSQGFSNIELISSLFLLSCFLGYLYERQGSLWASIGLHGFFNAMSIWMITSQ